MIHKKLLIRFFFTLLILLISFDFLVIFSVYQPISELPFITLVMILIHAVAALFSYILFYRPLRRIGSSLDNFRISQNFNKLKQNTSDYLSVEILETIQKLQDQKIDFSNSQKQAEYLALQNQINPHFLYNTLEALRGDTLAEGLTSQAALIEALATFFRYTITDTRNLTPLENELEHTENYFLIQKYRFGDKINMDIHYPEDKNDVLNLLIPKLTLQPIIENCIFHGLENKSDNGSVTIKIETTEQYLFVNISDTGIGIAPEQLHIMNHILNKPVSDEGKTNQDKQECIGLHNVSRRIKLLFGNEFGLHLYSTLGLGTDVRIILPKIQKGNLN